MKSRSPTWTLLGVLTLLCSCSSDELSIEKRSANRPPETLLVSSPPDSSSGVDYRVRLSWLGTDPDGTIHHFDFIMVEHPASKDNIDGSGAETVVISFPEPDDPRWQSTTRRDSTFITRADTLRHDPQPDDSTSAADIRELPWERWHTFFIRAVDNRGAADPSPDYVSFNATNIAPQVWLTEPVTAGVMLQARPTVQLHWDGQDPQGDGDWIDPVAARWVLIDSQIAPGRETLSYPDSLYVLPERFAWSEWFAWESAAGRHVLLDGLEQARTRPDGSVAGYYVFAVQARDEAGAVSAVFDRATPGKNNTVSIRVGSSLAPYLVVTEPNLGTFATTFDAGPLLATAVSGQTVGFRWHADASRYGGREIEYRYGWDLFNPEDPADWDQDWCADCVQNEPRVLTRGEHRFTLQARDNLGGLIEMRFILEVVEVSRDRDILLVDDTQEIIPGRGQEQSDDARWLAVLTQVASENGLQFNPALDVFDAVESWGNLPTFSMIYQARVVIWNVRETRAVSALAHIARFEDPFLEGWGGGYRHNFLTSYLRRGGRLLVLGNRAAATLWTDLTAVQRRHAVNVTNWDDHPIVKHPEVDSVGTQSLLYALGVEMFDCGAGTGCGPSPESPRTSRDHLCQGLSLTPEAQQAGAPPLEPGLTWAPDPPNTGRPNVEIYNMPHAMRQQQPPLSPVPGKSLVLYTFVSKVPEDEGAGVSYPRTADGQPVVIISKAHPTDAVYSRGILGLEVETLTPESHLALMEFLLVRMFGLGQAAAP